MGTSNETKTLVLRNSEIFVLLSKDKTLNYVTQKFYFYEEFRVVENLLLYCNLILINFMTV